MINEKADSKKLRARNSLKKVSNLTEGKLKTLAHNKRKTKNKNNFKNILEIQIITEKTFSFITKQT